MARRQRIYVGDLHPDVTREDVQGLITKVCPVESIHIPGKTPTGILRQFALVVVHCDDAQLLRCIKAFNGSLWKGAKLSVEAASKEYYVDRVERERQQHEMQLCEAHLAEQQRQQDMQPAPFCSAAVTVRSSRYRPRLVVSTRPGSTKGTALRCGRHVVFDDTGVAVVQEHEGEGEEAGEEEEEEEGGEGMEVEEDEVPAPATAAPAPAPKMGGGARLGFGSLLREVKSDGKRKTTTSLQPGTEDRDCCVEAPAGRRSVVAGSSSSSSSGVRGPAFMDYIDVTDEEEGAYGDGEEEGEGGTCVSAEDVGEEALARERRRTSAILAQLLRGAGADLGDSSNNTTTMVDSDATTTFGGSGAAEAPREAERPVHGRGWNVTQTLRYDPTSEAAHTLELSDTERLAILSAQRAENTRKAALLQEQQQQQQGQEGQADLGRLKEIFNRQGGVWFGDDGTTAEAVARGAEGQDKLFIEAEKHGLDLRQEEERGAMRFSFFGDDAGTDTTAASTLAPALALVPGLASEQPLSANYLDVEGIDSDVRPAAVVMSLAQVIQSARLFQRGRAEEDVVRDWQGMRDRASLGYKRKRKDAAKKGQGAGMGSGVAKYGGKTEARESEGGAEGPAGHRAFGKPRRGGKGKGKRTK